MFEETMPIGKYKNDFSLNGNHNKKTGTILESKFPQKI
jgi:hypothetical protein